MIEDFIELWKLRKALQRIAEADDSKQGGNSVNRSQQTLHSGAKGADTDRHEKGYSLRARVGLVFLLTKIQSFRQFSLPDTSDVWIQ